MMTFSEGHRGSWLCPHGQVIMQEGCEVLNHIARVVAVETLGVPTLDTVKSTLIPSSMV